MKIIYLIRVSTRHGVGGHYHSLKVTSEAMTQLHDCVIISIGKNTSPVIQSAEVKTHHVYCDGMNLVSALWKVQRICKDEKADILHSFDVGAYLFGRFASAFLKLPHVFTKCGGPDPQQYYPKIKTLICYSQENIAAFEVKKRYLKTNIYYIPNRVRKFDSSIDLINALEGEYRIDGELIFMRIARIGKSYERGFYQSIRLVELLNNNDIPAKLVIVGAIENEEIYQKLKESSSKCLLLTDRKYTDNAKKLIDFADCIIATGRGVMEAASKRKIIFVPSDKSDYPILLNLDNFNALLNKNFSPRVEVESEIKKDLEHFENILHYDNKKLEYHRFIDDKYNEYFDVNAVVDKYTSIYRKETFLGAYEVLDFLRHSISVSRSFFSS